jgi:serine/alanine adding enzyme
MEVGLYTQSDREPWDSYVLNHPDATHCHLSGWKRVIENAYGHKAYYLLAMGSSLSSNSSNSSNPSNSMNPSNSVNPSNRLIGILPLFHIKSLIFGNQLASMPFLNYGGILADDKESEIALLSEAVKLGKRLKASIIELRHTNPLWCLNGLTSVDLLNCSTAAPHHGSTFKSPVNLTTSTHKVRMLLKLPESKEELLKSFGAKLRSQISRPQKEGMTAVVGGGELIDSFYKVFSVNMRDLGSPVHSRKLFKEICGEFPQNVRIGVVRYKGAPVASGLIFCFRDTVEIPWASSLRKFNKFSPNMLLYWSFIEYVRDHGFEYFDFGRSTPEEGTYKFKEQWGAKPFPLYWHHIISNGYPVGHRGSQKSKFETLVQYWKKLPVPVSNMIGPFIRKRISL